MLYELRADAAWIQALFAITGSLDDNTTPQQAESYVAALSARGVRAEFRLLQGQTHNGAFRGPQVMEAVRGNRGERLPRVVHWPTFCS